MRASLKKNYDLLIIGGGSAGLMAVPSSRQLDLTVALAQKDRLGGDCTWTWCVPGKTLLRAAKSAQNINDAAGFDSSPRSTYRVLREKIHSGRRGPWWEGYENEEVNALIEEAQATVSDTARQAIYRQIYTIIRDDAPWIFLYNPTLYWGVGSAMEGGTPRTDGLLVFS